MSLEKAKELRRDADYALRKAQEIKSDAESEGNWNSEVEETFDRWASEAEEKLSRAEEIEAREDRTAQLEDKLKKREEPLVGEKSTRGFESDDFGAGGERELESEYKEQRDRYESAFVRFLRNRQTREDRKVLNRGAPVLRDNDVRYVTPSGVESRAGVQSVGTSGQGGVLVPEDFFEELIAEQKAFGGMRRTRARQFMTDSGGDMPVPTMADTANLGSFVNEGSTIGGTTNISFASVTLSAHMAQSGPIVASLEMVQDSAFDVAGMVRDALSERIGRRAEQKFFGSTSSTGTPLGLVTISTGAVKFNGTTDITWENLLTFKHSVDPAYRGQAEWMFSDNTFLELAKVTDTDGRPLLQIGQENRQANRLLNHPYVINQEVDDFGSSGNLPLWFGDFSHYVIRDVRALEIFNFQEKYMTNRRVGWTAFQRVDGKPISPTTNPALRPIRAVVENT